MESAKQRQTCKPSIWIGVMVKSSEIVMGENMLALFYVEKQACPHQFH